VLTYSLATRGSVGPDAAELPAVVAAVYADPRGWLRSHRRFTRVASGGDFTVVLAQASLVPVVLPQLQRAVQLPGRAATSSSTPTAGARGAAFPGSLEQYRQMVSTTRPATGSARPRLLPGVAGRRGHAAAVQGHAGLPPNAWPLDHELVGRPAGDLRPAPGQERRVNLEKVVFGFFVCSPRP
jgi:hypothetical protein